MIKIDDIIPVILLPKNEAEHPESTQVKIKAQIPYEDKLVYLGELLHQTKQDFGFAVGEFLMINVSIEDGKMSAYCVSSMKEQSI